MPTITTSSPLPDATQNGAYSTPLDAIKSGLNLLITDDGEAYDFADGGSLAIGDIPASVPHVRSMTIDCANCDDDLESILADIVAGSVNCTVAIDAAAPTAIDGGSIGAFDVSITPISDGPFTAKFKVTSDSDTIPSYEFDFTGTGIPAFIFDGGFLCPPDTLKADQGALYHDLWNGEFVYRYDDIVEFVDEGFTEENVSTTPAPDIDPDTTPPPAEEGSSGDFFPALLKAGELPGSWSILWDLGDPGFIDSFNASTGQLTYSPVPGDAGEYDFTLLYEDDVERMDSQAFTLTVTVP